MDVREYIFKYLIKAVCCIVLVSFINGCTSSDIKVQDKNATNLSLSASKRLVHRLHLKAGVESVQGEGVDKDVRHVYMADSNESVVVEDNWNVDFTITEHNIGLFYQLLDKKHFGLDIQAGYGSVRVGADVRRSGRTYEYERDEGGAHVAMQVSVPFAERYKVSAYISNLSGANYYTHFGAMLGVDVTSFLELKLGYFDKDVSMGDFDCSNCVPGFVSTNEYQYGDYQEEPDTEVPMTQDLSTRFDGDVRVESSGVKLEVNLKF